MNHAQDIVSTRAHRQPAGRAGWQGPLAMVLGSVLLLAGCASTGGGDVATAPGTFPAVETPESLRQIVIDAGFAATDLVLTAVLVLPRPENNPHAISPWQGVFSGSEKALFHAEDRILVVARALDVPQYRFSAALRVWEYFSAKQETSWKQVWFNGNAREFLQTVQLDRSSREILSSLSAPPAAAAFPRLVTTESLRAKLVSIGLTSLDQHLKTVHADGHPCTPEVRVYARLAPASVTGRVQPGLSPANQVVYFSDAETTQPTTKGFSP